MLIHKFREELELSYFHDEDSVVLHNPIGSDHRYRDFDWFGSVQSAPRGASGKLQQELKSRNRKRKLPDWWKDA